MCLWTAHQILLKPEFGNPLHIEALKLTQVEADIVALRKQLDFEKTECFDGSEDIEQLVMTRTYLMDEWGDF